MLSFSLFANKRPKIVSPSSLRSRSCPTCGAALLDSSFAFAYPVRTVDSAGRYKKPRVSQRWHGSTHKGSLAHAYDFDANVGDPVFASRDGVVVDLVGHFRPASTSLDEAHRARANYVVVRHDCDGKFIYSRYYHLDSVSTTVGSEVRVGDLLGYAGNTGFTSGPHVHFDVVDALPTDVLWLKRIDTDEMITCVTSTFSSVELPQETQTFHRIVFAEPFDLSTAHVGVSLTSANASCMVCIRGGDTTFREKAARATAAGASLLIIVDDDETMAGALPILVGDGGLEHARIWVVFVAHACLPMLKEAKEGFSLCASPYYNRRAPDLGVFAAASRVEYLSPFKPVSIPFEFDAPRSLRWDLMRCVSLPM